MEFVLPGPIRRKYHSGGIIFEDYFDRQEIGSNWDVTNLLSASIVDGKLVTEAIENNLYANVGAKYTGSLHLDGDFVVESDLEWVARSSDLARIIVVLFDSSDNVLAFAGIEDGWASGNPSFVGGINNPITGINEGWASGKNTRNDSGTMVINIERFGSTTYVYEDGNLRLSGTMTSIVDYIVLTNTRYLTYNGKTAKWDYVKITT